LKRYWVNFSASLPESATTMMMCNLITKSPTVLLPIENQVRELDPRLLLAGIAASRGLSAVVGPIREIDFHIASYPGSLYLSKSMLPGRLELFKTMRRLSIVICALDEEALVHLPPEIYYSRRLCPEAMAHVAHLFAWGRDNADLWRNYPDFPCAATIHLTGNPRNDMLRPEIRSFYEKEVCGLQRQYGKFILVNTNFNHVNAFHPKMNLFLPTTEQAETGTFGKAAKGMTLDYARGLWEHKQSVFRDFQQLIPALEGAFPDFTIIVRPHPTENHDVYREIANRSKRVRVTNDGNVVPWLLAAKALIHNGCTTGVEAYLMGVPSISYRASINDRYDNDFYRLPNMLSHQCFNFEELTATLSNIMFGNIGRVANDSFKKIVDYHLTGAEGPLASSRMVDVFEAILASRAASRGFSPLDFVKGIYKAYRRGLKKKRKSSSRNSHLKQDFQLHRYPEITIDDMQIRLSRFQRILPDLRNLHIEMVHKQSFRITRK
jgi:surface carbohydrate biosynthesis protein